MLEICNIVAGNIAELDVLNRTTVAAAIAELGELQNTRIIITDQNACAVYDSFEEASSEGKYIFFPEVMEALNRNDVFTWSFRNAAMHSHAATPILDYGSLIGCVYMSEYDATQGAMIASIQNNILLITAILELAVILFSFAFYSQYSRRLRKIMTSIRTVRGGDYTHKVTVGGSDELKTLGDEFNDLISRLQTSENKRQQFVSDASHELRTPLASIKLLTDSILHNDMDTVTVKEFVGDIGNEAERLNRLSQKLLTLSKIDSSDRCDIQNIYIAPTVEKVVRMLSANAGARQIQIIPELDRTLQIRMTEDDLYQVIFNLAENGIKYNKACGRLMIAVFRSGKKAVIRVQDTGVGIPKEPLRHIFERFYRVDKARSRATGGSGLGLSIVRNIVRKNHGHIHVESEPDVGTLFTLEFPAADTKEERS